MGVALNGRVRLIGVLSSSVSHPVGFIHHSSGCVPNLQLVGVSIMWWVCHMTSISHTQSSGILDTSPFRTPGLSIHKTMTMTAGEFDYDTIFGNSEDDKDQLTEFAGLAYFMWIVFLLAMHILLVNLLVSECICVWVHTYMYIPILCVDMYVLVLRQLIYQSIQSSCLI